MAGDQYPTEEGWPDHVTGITIGEMGRLGVHAKTNSLYWDGQALVTEKRFSSFERWLAVVGLLIASIGVAATVALAWAAFHPPFRQMTDLQYCVERTGADESGNTAFDALAYCSAVL